MLFRLSLLLSSFLWIFSSNANNSHINSEKIIISNVLADIKIDAKLDEEIWQQAKPISMNNITRPYDNIANSFNTQAFMVEDGDTLYVAFIADDPDPKNIRAYYRDRDKSWGDDLIGIKIDTFNDHRLAYRFFVNPLGAQVDGIENEITKNESDSWDGIWDSAGRITDTGYVVEMALPLRMLNFNDELNQQTWGIELVRYYPRDIMLRLSNIYMDRNNKCEVCQHVEATGFKQAKLGSNITVTPSLVLSSREQRDENANWYRENDSNLSLDVRWGVTPNTLLNATLNPDFSTVETDNAQLSINNTFALFNEEKRPFFLDNSDYFDSHYDLVYTRNINAPNFGAKLTGKYSDQTVAFFITDDDQTNILIPGNRGSAIATIDGKSKGSAFRYRKNVNTNTTLGLTSTYRSNDDYYNLVNGFDGDIKLSNTDTLKFQYLQSTTHYPEDFYQQFCQSDDPQDCQQPPQSEQCDLYQCDFNEQVLRTIDDTRFTGNAGILSYTHNSKYWLYKAAYESQNSGFRGDLGFIPKIDSNKFKVGGERRWFAEPDQWWTQFEIYSDYDTTHNDDGELIEEEFDIKTSIEGIYNSWLQLAYTHRNAVGSRLDKSSLAIDGNTTMFKQNVWQFNTHIKPIAGVTIDSDFIYGDKIDFSGNRNGTTYEVHPMLKWNINSHLEMKLKHSFSKLDADGANKYIARLTDLRTTYQFDLQSFLRFTMIFNNTSRNPDNYLYQDSDDIDANTKDLNLELLYGYKFNPQTVFYLGYSEHSQGEDNFDNMEKDDKSVFLKLSYASIH
ncbi:DUF5916 domain-containing protein [Thalassotalea nanhaiensis]|uniref:DUF5916 domain-containing protein n=1 Tax=Thalassotalea nanhaiensis TaxID=3065648 RepID=A0ABY9TLI9_9GAMM|nr:DUF5916 domain-containing protein [Colwelliaceae bacterium SQ345]